MYYTQKIQKLKQNSKALSPVVASIILIAVTVAVSIAVAAWMGGLAGGFMQTEQVQINTVTFDEGTEGKIHIEVMNTGTSAITISEIQVNGLSKVTNTTNSADRTIQPNEKIGIAVTSEVSYGDNYQVKVITSKNNAFTATAIAS